MTTGTVDLVSDPWPDAEEEPPAATTGCGLAGLTPPCAGAPGRRGAGWLAAGGGNCGCEITSVLPFFETRSDKDPWLWSIGNSWISARRSGTPEAADTSVGSMPWLMTRLCSNVTLLATVVCGKMLAACSGVKAYRAGVKSVIRSTGMNV